MCRNNTITLQVTNESPPEGEKETSRPVRKYSRIGCSDSDADVSYRNFSPKLPRQNVDQASIQDDFIDWISKYACQVGYASIVAMR